MTISNKKHVQCRVVKGQLSKTVFIPHNLAKVGLKTKVQGDGGWTVSRIMSAPQDPPAKPEELPIGANEAAASLEKQLKGLGDFLFVGIGMKDEQKVLMVYVKNAFEGDVPKVWDSFPVYVERTGDVKPL